MFQYDNLIWEITFEIHLKKWKVKVTKHPKSEKSPDLLYNFFQPRLRRGRKK